MSTQVLWTHGNALVVEDEGEYAFIRHRGWGTQLSFNTPSDDDDGYRVCHVPLPTPPIVDGVAPTLSRISVLFEAASNVIVARVDVWDANTLVTSFSHHGGFEPAAGLWVGTGSQLTPGRNNQMPLSEPYVPSSGLGVSLVCSLFQVPPVELLVVAVGAAFVYPNPNLEKFGSLVNSNAASSAVKRKGGG